MRQQNERRLIEATGVDLRVIDDGWAFSRRHEAEIAEHWARLAAENPQYFDGTILLLSDYSMSDDGVFSGRLLRTDFKSFLYWRACGWPEAAVRDTFCTGLIRSCDGHVLLCQQQPGHLNDGLSTPPGGFIDARDVAPDGTIDLARAVAREIVEETGLGAAHVRQGTGYAIVLTGHQVSLAVPWHSDLSGDALAREARRHIEAEPEGELLRVLALSPGEALQTLTLPDYARALLGASHILKTPA